MGIPKATKYILIGGATVGLLGYTMGPADIVQATHTVVGATVWGTAVSAGAVKDEAPAAWRGGWNAGTGQPMFGPEPDVEGEAKKAAADEADKVAAEKKAADLKKKNAALKKKLAEAEAKK